MTICKIIEAVPEDLIQSSKIIRILGPGTIRKSTIFPDRLRIDIEGREPSLKPCQAVVGEGLDFLRHVETLLSNDGLYLDNASYSPRSYLGFYPEHVSGIFYEVGSNDGSFNPLSRSLPS